MKEKNYEITVNFLIQLCIDLFSTPVIKRIGYRMAMLISNASVVMGLVLLTLLPGSLERPFAGILIAVCVYAIGGGLQEVLVSPIAEACPTKNKESAMSLLHSFYCWGHVGVVLLSTLFFRLAGIANWSLRAGGESMGLRLCGEGTWGVKTDGGSAGPHAVCHLHGNFAGLIWRERTEIGFKAIKR